MGLAIGIFKKLFSNVLLLTIIIVVNLLGSIIGFYYYYQQLSSSPLYLWPFIPDCPLYTLLTAAILMTLILTKKSSDTLNFITSVGLAKYGTWTVLVVLVFNQFYFSVDQNMYTILACIHVLMAVEFILPLFIMRGIKNNYTVIAFLWFFVNDFFDYFFGTHPPLPYWGVNSVAYMTFLITPIFIIIVITTRKFLNYGDLNLYASAGVAKLGQRRRA